MGKGPKVEELAQEDADFRKYLEQIRGEVEADQAHGIKELEKIIDQYYTDGGWSYKPLMQLNALEVQQVSEWSLDNVSKILGAVRDAIFGDSAPPAGTEIEKPGDVGLALSEMMDLNLLVMNKAFAAVQSILATFATESSYRGKALTKTELVAPGITVFVSIRSDVWRSQGFFNNDSIAQYLYIVRSFFSADQAGDIAKFNSVLAYTELATAFDQRIEELARMVANPATPFSALPELMQIMAFLSDQLSFIHAKIAELRSQKVTRLMAASHKALADRKSVSN